MDTGHRQADKELEKIAKEIIRIFDSVDSKVIKKMKAYLRKFKSEIKEHERMVDEGIMTEAEYEKWFTSRIMTTKEWKKLVEDISAECEKGTEKAMAFAGMTLAAVYAFNRSFSARQIELQARKYLGRQIKFSSITKPRKRLLPKSPDRKRNRVWHRRKIESVIRSGMKKGKSIDKIARELNRVTKMDRVSCYRAARTGVTSAENMARIDSMFEAEEMGIGMDKIWIAALDARTRTSHRVIHGQRIPCTEYFSNGLFYPADPDGEPAEVYNCRCTLGGIPIGVAMDLKDAPSGMGNLEWAAQKPESKPYPVWRE